MTIPELHQVFLNHPVVCTDTRKISRNSIFFALKGASFNGNEFAEKALEAGSAYAIVDEEKYCKNERTILVSDVLKCLQDLAAYHRKHWGKTIIALTGSNGKTTTKELMAAVLSKKYNCLYTSGNLNNHIGVPLTLLNLTTKHDIAVVEMGANHQLEIALLCTIAQPNYGIITNIGKAHLEGFGGEEGVLKGKGEMYAYIQASQGTIFINGDDAKLNSIKHNIQAISYGFGQDNNVHATLVNGTEWAVVLLPYQGVEYTIKSNLTGGYNGINILCAAAIGLHFGVAPQDIKNAIEEYQPENNRSQVFNTPNNILILDAYNANPSSLHLAIENLVGIQAAHKFFVIGEMREMGAYAEMEHKAILEQLKRSHLNGVLVGKDFSKFKEQYNFHFFDSSSEAKPFLQNLKLKDHTILIKGSRGVKLEEVIDAF